MLPAFFASVGSILVNATRIINTVVIAIKAIQVIANTIMAVCKELGLIENKDINVEELGSKALAAEEEGIKPENFETYEAYVKEIEKFEVDPTKAESWSEEEKATRGTIVTTGLLLEKYGPVVADVIVELSKRPDFFTTDRVKLYLDLASDQQIDIQQISRYLNGDIKNFNELRTINDVMLEIETKLNPHLTTEEKQQNINEQKAQQQ
ncbi:hypothetical protein JCM9140_3683 [Halalkalibacter wakoensis JCM 9140]|uniref:Uncharacterized protein n=1 Tax=Halalkalibacter wakoensis JCM 9140 TaxID=1236970 RepID=W4Q635_9BACI|nr:hypothetical protein [Halalkalibacter wakoensis]GAE27531.1 hypothetical protein JCM9140_3683 [Halalkalibacter wakoensis JCM 9140]